MDTILRKTLKEIISYDDDDRKKFFTTYAKLHHDPGPLTTYIKLYVSNSEERSKFLNELLEVYSQALYMHACMGGCGMKINYELDKDGNATTMTCFRCEQ